MDRRYWFPRRLNLAYGFFLVCMYLIGGLLIQSPAQASEESEVLLARGNKLYLDSKFNEAKDNLVRAAKLDSNNPEIWSLLGTTDLVLKDYQAAKDSFSRTIALDPNYPQAKLYLGVANYYLGDYQEANRVLNEAKAVAPDEGLAYYYLGLVAAQQGRPKDALTNLELGMNVAPQFALGFKGYQAAVQPVTPPTKPYYISFTIGQEYDDNAKVLPDKTTVPGRGQYNGHKADWQTPTIINASYEPLRTEQWTAGVRYYGYAGFYYRDHQFSSNEQLGELYAKYRINSLTISPFYTFDYTWVGYQPWSMINGGGLRLTLAETANLTGDLIYMFQNRDFKYFSLQITNNAGPNNVGGDPYNRTGNMSQVGFFQTLSGSAGTLRAGFIWEREMTEGINFSCNRYRFPVEGYLNLPWKILAYGYLEYANSAFNNRDSFANKYQNSNYYQVIAQLRRPVTSWMTVIAGYSHISNPSNIQDYQYARNIYQLMMMFQY